MQKAEVKKTSALKLSPGSLRAILFYDILTLPNKPHISLDSGNGFYLGKNAFSVFAFPVISEGLFGDKWSSAFFAHSSGCALF